MRHFVRVRKASFGALVPQSEPSYSEVAVQNNIVNGYSRPEDWCELIPISVQETIETKTVEVKKCAVL